MHGATPEGGWERLFWLIFRHSSNPVGLLDEERRILDLNDAGLALLQATREQTIGTSIADAVLPAEQAEATRQWEAFLRTGRYSGTRDLVRPDGSTVVVDFAAQLAVVDGQRLAIYVIVAKAESWPTAKPADASRKALTRREREVVTLIAMGLETDEIAEELHVSPETVRTHVRNAMSKLGAHTRAQLVAIALRDDRSIHIPHVHARADGAGDED
jgi:PAS domain S-box-containing protein